MDDTIHHADALRVVKSQNDNESLRAKVEEQARDITFCKGLLAGAMVALGRQGWEDGPSDGVVQNRIWDYMDADNEFSGLPDGPEVDGNTKLKALWEAALRGEEKP